MAQKKPIITKNSTWGSSSSTGMKFEVKTYKIEGQAPQENVGWREHKTGAINIEIFCPTHKGRFVILPISEPRVCCFL